MLNEPAGIEMPNSVHEPDVVNPLIVRLPLAVYVNPKFGVAPPLTETLPKGCDPGLEAALAPQAVPTPTLQRTSETTKLRRRM
jgi:hypothetical protein